MLDLNLEREACHRYKTQFVKTIKATAQYFYQSSIGIITSTEQCNLLFAEDLRSEFVSMQKDIHRDDDEGVVINKFSFRTDPLHVAQLQHIMYTLKVKSTGLIILLLHASIVELVFKLASGYAMLSYDTVWMTVDFGAPVSTKFYPSQLLNLKLSLNNQNKRWKFRTVEYIVSKAILVVVAAEKIKLEGNKTSTGEDR